MTTAFIILVFLIVVALMLRHLQRTFFYPKPGPMPAAVTESTEDILKRFEDSLERHAPDMLASLQPGLSDEQIAGIERRYRFRLTDDLRALYRWRNGSPPKDIADLIPGHRFLPLEYAAEQREGMKRGVATEPLVARITHWIFAGHRTGWLTILDDLCGDGYFYDPGCRHREGAFFYLFTEDRYYRYFPSLANFLAGAIECYETGVYRSCRRGPGAEDHQRSFKLWERYAVGPRA